MYKSSPTQRAPSEPPEAVPSLSGRQLSADEDTLRQRLISAVQRPSGSGKAGQLADTLSLRSVQHIRYLCRAGSPDLKLPFSTPPILNPNTELELQTQACSREMSAIHQYVITPQCHGVNLCTGDHALAGAWRRIGPTKFQRHQHHTALSVPSGQLAMAAGHLARKLPPDQSRPRKLLLSMSGKS